MHLYHMAMIKAVFKIVLFQETSPLRVPNIVYQLVLPDENTARFEDKIREAEKEIGIAPENGVLILYKRQLK